MKQAEKFNRPIFTFIDTKGAYPGKAAEERGQSESIATNLIEMASLKVPVVAIVIGEGGSGGALELVFLIVYLCLKIVRIQLFLLRCCCTFMER